MRVIRGLKNLKTPVKGSVITVGVFDGVHIGHSRLIREVVSRAHKLRLRSVVVTFDPHPAKALGRTHSVPSLVSLDHRIRLVEALGPDILLILNFTRSFARMAPARFVSAILVDNLGMKEIYAGEDFYFGAGASSGMAELKKLSRQFGFDVKQVLPVKAGGRAVSSSLIRKLIMEGRISEASRLLGRPVSVLGTVVRGARLARQLGYPTANINPHHEAMPPSGVYAVRALYGGRYYGGVLNIGTRPTFYGPKDREPSVEVHIFNFDKRIYGKEVEVLFIKKIRNERRFKNIKDLITQIRKDTAIAKNYTLTRNC